MRYFSLLLCAGFFMSCTNSELYEKGTKQLDSLEGAMGLISKEILSSDTLQLQKALERFTTYRLFIKTNVNDTILPGEAENIKRFFASGTALEAYSKNRPVLLERAGLIHTQITKLRNDISNLLIDEQVLMMALEKENKTSAELTGLMLEQQKKYYSALQEFKQVLPLTEEFIRKHNKGDLPTLVKQNEDF
ncbi:MAG: hypothetical protein JNK73_13320 [Bacteroidia bacterium]|nr:hypothetical protein [Bacteroidia bacterium]